MATTMALSLAHPGYNFPPEVLNDPPMPFRDDPERPAYPPTSGFKRGFWEKRTGTQASRDGFDPELEVADYPVQVRGRGAGHAGLAVMRAMSVWCIDETHTDV